MGEPFRNPFLSDQLCSDELGFPFCTFHTEASWKPCVVLCEITMEKSISKSTPVLSENGSGTGVPRFFMIFIYNVSLSCGRHPFTLLCCFQVIVLKKNQF